jgi:hypothetical protein
MPSYIKLIIESRYYKIESEFTSVRTDIQAMVENMGGQGMVA